MTMTIKVTLCIVYCVTLVGIQCPGLQITDACNDMTWFQHQYTQSREEE
ncbi:hypothetical protein HanHA300_Chr16g0632321 [Helianthus annuus]|nr:hypothetical protein HanHA300_Chr16g0632321 [Helianthus annuus]KAJ0462445.1 hypothetical protein HanHA89_Chr16g0683471 [Helianthus annuus]